MQFFVIYLIISCSILSSNLSLKVKKAVNLQEIFEQIDQKIKDINEIKKQMQSNEQTISSLKNQTAIILGQNF